MSNRKRYGYEAPVKVIAAMQRPRTINGIVKVTGFSRRHVSTIVATIRDMDMAHVNAWSKRKGMSAQRMYLFGYGEDEPCQTKVREESKAYDVELCTRILVKVIKLIQDELVTQAQICERTEISEKTCSNIMRMLVANELAHVTSYTKRSHDGYAAMQYAFGKGENVERPKGMTKLEKSRHYNFLRSAKGLDCFSVAVRQIEAANEERRAA